MPGVFDTPVNFEPTFTFMGFLYRADDVRPPFAVEDRFCVAVAHLALLGVKRQETALWVFLCRKRKNASILRLFREILLGSELFRQIKKKLDYFKLTSV